MTTADQVSAASWHVRVAGGLGNQLFQYGTARLLAQRWGGTLSLTDHTQRYAEARQLSLATVISITSTTAPRWVAQAHSWRVGRMPGLCGIQDRNITRVLNASNCPKGWAGHHLLDGYFQDCWTTDTVGALVKAISTVAKPVAAGSHIALHIRGGDFLRLPDYQIISPDFYRRALSQLTALLDATSLDVHVITDDIPYARSVLQNEASDRLSFRYADSAGIAADFERLRTARARIVGNSTFAWWASALRAAVGPTLSCARWTVQRDRPYRLPDEIAVG